MTLLRISHKIHILLAIIVIMLTLILWWIFTFKIEMQINTIVKVDEYGMKLLINANDINYILPFKKIVIRLKNQFFNLKITRIKWDNEKKYYELETNDPPMLLANSSINVQIIYNYIRVIDYIFSPSV